MTSEKGQVLMELWAPAVTFLALVGVPGLIQLVLIRRLRRHRTDSLDPAGRSSGWSRADAEFRNYSPAGKRILFFVHLLQVVLLVGFVVWGFMFVL
jgi:hypothetical protein